MAEFWERQEEGSKKKKLDSWEIFQEIGCSAYSKILAQNLRLEGYFEKVFFYKVEEDSKHY